MSYDYRLLLATIPRYLHFVDEVLLGVDSEGLTWSGERFDIPASFFAELRLIDENPSKIRLVSQPFYLASRSPMENEVIERNVLSKEARHDNWLVSFDADEVLLNPEEFFGFIQRVKRRARDVDVDVRLITVFKDLGGAVLIVAAQEDGALEQCPVGTRKRDAFAVGRRTGAESVLSPGLVLHYAWARSEEDLLLKLRNWGHSRDFDAQKYFEFWRGVTEENYRSLREFHPIWPRLWPRLVMVDKRNLDDLDLRALRCHEGSAAGMAVRRVWEGLVKRWRRRPLGRLKGDGGGRKSAR